MLNNWMFILNRMQNEFMQDPSLGADKNGSSMGGTLNSSFKVKQCKVEYKGK